MARALPVFAAEAAPTGVACGLRQFDASLIAIKRAGRYSDGPFFVASLTKS